VADAVAGAARALDGAGFETAHLAGTSLGGYLALRLAERGRARSVVAFAPAGGWADGGFAAGLFARQEAVHAQLVAAAPTVDTLVATPEGRRRATELVTERSEHLPPELVAHLAVGGARADAANLLATARQAEWSLDPDRVDVPVRIVWGTADRLLPWPEAAARWREGLPRAEWVVLDGVGHAVQLDVPLEAAELILGVTAR
jgi:pimeloyl-ACP methyl ester carboxylesterase